MKLELLVDDVRSDVHRLVVDGEAFRILPKVFYGFRKFKLKAQALEELEVELEEIEKKGVKRYALNRLAAKGYHSEELQRLLLRKGASFPVIALVLQECRDSGFINDLQWIESTVNRLQREKKGANFISQKLKGMGISDREILPFLQKVKDGEEVSIRRLIETKYRNRNLLDSKEKQKVIASLARKGFSFCNIVKELVNLQRDQDN